MLGIASRGRKFDPEKFALQTGTGLTFNQIAIGFAAWVGGSFFAGMALGFFASLMFGIAGGLLYAGTLADRRQEFTLSQAKDILRGLQVVETLLTQGKTLFDSWTEAANSVGPDGQVVLVDLVTRLRACPSGEEGTAVREWADNWSNPGRRYRCHRSVQSLYPVNRRCADDREPAGHIIGSCGNPLSRACSCQRY